MTYLNWDAKIITDFSPENVASMYDAGYVFTRVDKGVMNKTRSFRIDLEKFELSSENRRILRKAENYKLEIVPLPLADYSWHIGKLAKNFYEAHDAEFSANKIKELLTDAKKSNFNTLAEFSLPTGKFGYVISYNSPEIFHYSYPFYEKSSSDPSRGLQMMLKTIEWAKSAGKRYIYLGSLQRPSDTYKLQFKGGEWFDGENWQTDISPLKQILK
ncbi:MAG TPA: hypothetical protein VMR73_00270 [Candidatus Paceibacterota bacterium]|nr:hypothetical protein [Candidatus Paceibacterota bacterium]